MLNRLLIAASVAWFSATFLALLFAAGTSGDLSIHALLLPGVIPIAVISSTIIASIMTPLVYWGLALKSRDLIVYGLGLFLLLATYIGTVTPTNPALSLYGSLAMGAAGVVAIGFIHRIRKRSTATT